MKQIYVNCSCGGGASVNVEDDAKEAVVECACEKVLFWTDDGAVRIEDKNPPTLGISVGSESKTTEKFG